MTAISREGSESVYYRIIEIRDAVIDDVKAKAHELSRDVSSFEIKSLLTQGFRDFSAKVSIEYATTSYKDLAELLIPSHKQAFFTDKYLWGKVRQIVQENQF